MKKISNFLIKLKPYKRKYKMFWLIFTLFTLFLFQMIMLIFSSVVDHINSGFYYWIRGFHSLLVDSRNEPNSAQGFIFASTVIGTIPSVAIIPFLYFIFTNWLINEKLSDKFINVPTEKYKFWTNYIHFSGIALVFTLLCGSLTYINNGGLLPNQAYNAILGAFSDDFGERIAGISAFLYYGIGMVFLFIMIVWNILIALSWIGKKISILLEKWSEIRAAKKEQKLAKKIEKMESKKNNKQ
ncbi:hypothetical protein [Spiroplasma turonicum]|uniref:Transmembrane protein n=1 Tax=Spiroplasma turonicum TaxID=216946 RepID=A0A0K1P5F6_9MOLU|nr:hypothetical protein [Spiroplasma turonicum]AKU79531.1 hypothetical protein STURON_00285 [Spiroplasma turonicum]ALX70554.1 hypothetical protein STURO_v1c02860 [Spiroplasma turonicum]